MDDRLSHIEDQLLVMAAQEGNSAAMDELVRRWQKRLWHYVFRMTSDAHGAWDITQECWLVIIRRIGKLHDPASFKPWAYRIATNKAIDWLKRRNRYQHIHLDAFQAACDPHHEAAPVREMVKGLKEASRVVLSLYYFEQLSVGEISEVLQIPPGTVKSRLFQARAELKRSWERLDHDIPPRQENGPKTDRSDP